MRITSRLRSLVLCAFSVLSARILKRERLVVRDQRRDRAHAEHLRRRQPVAPVRRPESALRAAHHDHRIEERARLVDLLRAAASRASATGRAGTASARARERQHRDAAAGAPRADRGTRRSARRRPPRTCSDSAASSGASSAVGVLAASSPRFSFAGVSRLRAAPGLALPFALALGFRGLVLLRCGSGHGSSLLRRLGRAAARARRSAARRSAPRSRRRRR